MDQFRAQFSVVGKCRAAYKRAALSRLDPRKGNWVCEPFGVLPFDAVAGIISDQLDMAAIDEFPEMALSAPFSLWHRAREAADIAERSGAVGVRVVGKFWQQIGKRFVPIGATPDLMRMAGAR